MDKNTKFSIIIPCYNHSNYIEATILSALCATSSYGEKSEIIVVNDGSTDDSILKIKAISSRSNCITIIDLPSNVGRCEARNIGIKKSSGDYIIPLDSDNNLLPHALPTLDYFIKRYKDVKAWSINMNLINESGALLPGLFYNNDLASRLGHLNENLLLNSLIDTFGCYHKSVFYAINFDKSLSSHEDWDLWIRILFIKKMAIGYISDSLAQYRRRSSYIEDYAYSNKNANNDRIKIYNFILNNINVSKDVRRLIEQKIDVNIQANAILPEDFIYSKYLEINPDVAGMDPAYHYMCFGIKEGRRYK